MPHSVTEISRILEPSLWRGNEVESRLQGRSPRDLSRSIQRRRSLMSFHGFGRLASAILQCCVVECHFDGVGIILRLRAMDKLGDSLRTPET